MLGSLAVLGLAAAAAPARHAEEEPVEPRIGLEDYQKRPFCDPSSPAPPVKGYMLQDNLVLDAGCRYAPFESPSAAACLSGSWMVIMGSSNTILQFNNLINFLAPDEYFIDRTGELIGVSAVVDMMIQNRKVIHWKTIDGEEADCLQLNLTDAAKLRPKCGALMSALFAGAPDHAHDIIRITFVTSFFWYRSTLALEAVQADVKWRNAKVAVVAQIGAWYMYCMIIKFKYCPRKELIPVELCKGGGVELYARETNEALDQLEVFCNGDRALGCAVQTISWSNGARDKKAYEALNVPLKKDMISRATAKFRFVDFFALGGVMPKEVVEGHGSQLLNLWIWTVMFNGLCPAELGSLKPVARFTGTMCTALKQSFSKCPQYQKLCNYNTEHDGPVCMDWVCMNSVPCNLSTHDVDVPLDNKHDGSGCEMNLSSLTAGFARAARTAQPPLPWGLPALVTLLALSFKALSLVGSGTSRVALGEAEPLTSPRDGFTARSTPNALDSGGPGPGAGNHGFPALGLALSLASTHVALSEAFTWGTVPPWEFFGWGEMWVPFLIMVTGFLLMAGHESQSKGENPEGQGKVTDDLQPFFFYPLYALALLWTFVSAKLQGNHLDVGTLVAQAFLVQTWVPGLEDQLLPECRWLSCLALYCLGFKGLAVGVRRLNLPSTILLMSFLLLLPWSIILLSVSAGPTEHTDLTLNLGGGLRAHHPLSYLHVFLLGLLSAQLRTLLDPQLPSAVALQLAAPLGMLGLLLVQGFQVIQLRESEGFAVCKPLLFPQVLILVGLVGLPSRPLPYVASAFSYLDFLKEYWWPLCVTSPCILAVWPGESSPWHVFLLVLLLYASAFLVSHCIQKPLQRCWASASTWVMLALPMLVAGLLVAGYLLPLPAAAPGAAAPPRRGDVALLRMGREVVKPAMVVTQHEVMLLAQKQYVTWARSCGVHQDVDGRIHQAVILEETVHAELLVGRQPLPLRGEALKAFEVEPWRTLTWTSSAWNELCVFERWFPANRTLLRRIARGPENAKPLVLGDATAVLVESMPPKGGGCPRSDVRATQMYLSVNERPAERLNYGLINAEEKNWIPFVHKGSLHFVYPPVPHVILNASASGRTQRLWQSEFPPLQRLQQRAPQVEFHGSGQAVLVDQKEAASHPFYLAVMHALNRDNEKAGTTYFAYRFAAEPPFEMLQVSSPIPLPPGAAVSGLALLRDELLLSYSDERQESRALVISLKELEQLFSC